MKFSVIVPVYNVAPYLQECLDSVLLQTFVDWECICVDDGSTDGCSVILDEYEAKDGRFKVSHQLNSGAGFARNVGLDRAIGERIVFLDGDDVMMPECLATLNMVSGDVCLCRHVGVNDNASSCNEWKVVTKIALDTCDRGMCDACYTRKLLDDVRFKDYHWGEDHLFAAEALSKASCIVATNMSLFKVRDREGSLSRSGISVKQLRERFGVERARFATLAKSRLAVDNKVFQRIGHSLIECFVRDIGLLPKSNRQEAWQLWFDAINELPKEMVGKFSKYTRFVIAMSSAIQNRYIAYMLCLWPLKILLWMKGAN